MEITLVYYTVMVASTFLLDRFSVLSKWHKSSYIKEFRVKCLTTAEVDEFTSFLTAVRLKPGFITNFIHRQNVRERLKIPNCSLCGEVMTIRKARIGANSGSMFWGCTGFPDCRGSRDFE